MKRQQNKKQNTDTNVFNATQKHVGTESLRLITQDSPANNLQNFKKRLNVDFVFKLSKKKNSLNGNVVRR